MELTDLTIKEAHEGLADKEFSAAELAKAYLEKIEKENKEIFAFLSTSRDLATKQAKEADEKIKRGDPLPCLAGSRWRSKISFWLTG